VRAPPRIIGNVRSTGLLVLGLLALQSGCGQPSGDPWGKESDPASETEISDLFEIPERTLAAEPDLRVGEGDDAALFFHRINDVRVRADGSLVVADAGDYRLYVITPAGELQSEMGAPGPGPGEFRRIAGAIPVGANSLVVFDPAALRLTSLDATGDVLETKRLQSPDDARYALDIYHLADRAEDGSVILIPRGRVVRTELEPGVRRETMPVLRYASDGERPVPLQASQEFEIWDTEQGSIEVPHGDHRSVAAGAGRVVEVGHQEGRVRVWYRDGSMREITLAMEQRPMHPSARGAWIASYTSRIEDRSQRQQAEALLGQVPFPETTPYVSDVRVDQGGAIWLAVADLDPDRTSDRWIRIDDDGRATDRVRIPLSLRPQVIDDTQVIGIWTDSLGVQSVRRYRWNEGT
jgi:hypothetical protein